METLDKHFRALTGAAFQRHGFAHQDVVSHWSAIAGANMADACVPERIRWPRPIAGEKRLAGGTLELKAYAGRGLDVQHGAATLMERVNQFLGYQAVTKVKVHQSFEVPPVAKVKAGPEPAAAPQPGIDDPLLAAALGRLAAAVHSTPTRSPQGK